MKQQEPYLVVLFDSTSAALLAEKLLKERAITYKIIPVPRHISSDCGICIRVPAAEKASVEDVLTNRVDVQGILPL